MKSKPVYIRWLPEAEAAWRLLAAPQRAQARRLIDALKIAPMAGQFVRYDRSGRPLFVASAWDTYVVYTVTYLQIADRVYIVDVFLQEWEPKHTQDPLPPNIQ